MVNYFIKVCNLQQSNKQEPAASISINNGGARGVNGEEPCLCTLCVWLHNVGFVDTFSWCYNISLRNFKINLLMYICVYYSGSDSFFKQNLMYFKNQKENLRIITSNSFIFTKHKEYSSIEPLMTKKQQFDQVFTGTKSQTGTT